MLDSKIIEKAVEALKASELVAFPTETVYGLGADASSDAALARLYRVKGRPTSHPVIVHVASVDKLSDWASDIPEQAYLLAERFWPGPMTLILKKQPQVSLNVTGGQDSVGLRIPSHPVALQLLSAFGGGLAAPSANRFGKLSPTTAQSVTNDLGADVAMVLDGGACQVGIESTIISLVDGIRILRPGMLTQAAIEEALGQSVAHGLDSKVRAPGTLESHYAPETGVAVVEPANLAEALHDLQSRSKSYCLMIFNDTLESLPKTLVPSAARLLVMERESQSYARLLYQSLKDLDQLKCDYIVVEALPQNSDWDGIRDRLSRSSFGTVLAGRSD